MASAFRTRRRGRCGRRVLAGDLFRSMAEQMRCSGCPRHWTLGRLTTERHLITRWNETGEERSGLAHDLRCNRRRRRTIQLPLKFGIAIRHWHAVVLPGMARHRASLQQLWWWRTTRRLGRPRSRFWLNGLGSTCISFFMPACNDITLTLALTALSMTRFTFNTCGPSWSGARPRPPSPL